MTYQFRPHDGTDTDYEATVYIDNACQPEDPTTIENAKSEDAKRPPDHMFTRYVCVHNGRIVGSGCYLLAYWYGTPDQFLVSWSLLPEHREAAGALFLNYLKKEVAPHDPQRYIGYIREDKPIKKAILEADGFKLSQRAPRSQLDVASFDRTAYEGLRPKLEADGIEFITLTEYKKRDPDWVVTYEGASWEAGEGMPTSEPRVRHPVSQFAQQFSEPGHLSDGHIFALKAGEIIGFSAVSVNTVTNEKFYTVFTGVKPRYRRKGIATALKVEIIKFAQAYGATIIETDNEESNPMYTLNMQLGFEPLPADLEYKRLA